MRRLHGLKGFTLVEVMIGTILLALVFSAIYSVLATSSQFYAASVSLEHIQEQARRVVDEMAEEIRLADQATMIISTVNGSNQAAFRKCTGYTGGAPQWSTTITWNYQTSVVDANSNGVADEGSVVRTFNARSITKCHNVQLGGLVLTRTGDNVLIRLTLIGVDSKRQLIQTFVETSVTLRNSST